MMKFVETEIKRITKYFELNKLVVLVEEYNNGFDVEVIVYTEKDFISIPYKTYETEKQAITAGKKLATNLKKKYLNVSFEISNC